MTETPTITDARVLLDERQLDALDGLRYDLMQVVRGRLPTLLALVADGTLTRRQAGTLLVELTRRRASGQCLPPTSEAIEDIIELGRLARPIPDATLRRIERGPACQQLAQNSWDERTGTRAGHDAHRAAGEPDCPACLAAVRGVERDRARARRARARRAVAA